MFYWVLKNSETISYKNIHLKNIESEEKKML